jgi:WD40 repeat protein
MRSAIVLGGAVAFMLGCSVLAQRNAEKPQGTHYSAAFIKAGKLVIFPFDRAEITTDLPSALNGNTFSADGRKIYGFAESPEAEAPPIIAATIKPPSVSPLKASQGLGYLKSVAADVDGGIVAVSAVYRHGGVQECGLFELDVEKGSIMHILNNPRGECFDFVSSWNQLSLSPDGSRLVATAGSGRLAVINLGERRIEKTWPGAAAWWSPDGKWIAALTFGSPSEINLIRASDLSTERMLGRDTIGRLQWSPDSRYLLLLDNGLCGAGLGYFGTLQMLDIGTGQRMAIESSRCKVNVMSTGWVSDDVLK